MKKREKTIEHLRNDMFYLCSLIEYMARMTINVCSVMVNVLGEKELRVVAVYNSWIAQKIDNYRNSMYYKNNGYSSCSYKVGRAL